MKRVCILCETWETGGVESFICNVLKRVDTSRLQIDIVVAQLKSSIFTERLEKVGIAFYELSGKPRNMPENRRRFVELLNERHWDVVYLNAFQGLALYYLHLAKKAGIPVRIAHSHNTALRKSRTQRLKLQIHNIARAIYTGDATELWACSGAAAEFLFSKSELEEKGYRFIPNGINTERFRFNPTVRETIRKELGFEEKLVIGNIGRLCYQKNQDFLLDVFAEVVKRNPESRLLLIGEGEDHPLLEQKAKGLGIADKVLFYGLTETPEQLLWAMDVYVFPSRFEGLGIVAIEAQAAGLPVIASEYVPGEARISPLFEEMSLTAGADQWAGRILTAPMREPENVEVVRAAGFDISETARLIERKFEAE